LIEKIDEKEIGLKNEKRENDSERLFFGYAKVEPMLVVSGAIRVKFA